MDGRATHPHLILRIKTVIYIKRLMLPGTTDALLPLLVTLTSYDLWSQQPKRSSVR